MFLPICLIKYNVSKNSANILIALLFTFYSYRMNEHDKVRAKLKWWFDEAFRWIMSGWELKSN